MIVIAKPKRSAASAWLDRVNPLQGLSIQQAKNIFDIARAHGSPLLQKIYDEIELTDPVLMTCVERRQSALAGLGWRVVANASAKDQGLAEEQRAAIEEFASGIENLDDAIEHLDLAFFRGYSVCQPIWESGRVRTVNVLNSWNFLRGDDGRLVWNPDCTLDVNGCVEITPAARTVQLVRRRAIDWPALTIYIRKYVGERDWGRCLERYGVPPVDAVMGPNTSTEQRDEYLECAEAAKEGRVVVWPSGTTASRAEGIRGQDPFTAFIEHQEKLIVLMSTGGTLTSLAQADTGALAGGAQMDVWSQIVQRDGVVISGALNRGLFNRFLSDAYPGRPLAAHFEIGMEEEPSAAEAADLAGKISVAGFTVDKSQLEEKTGFKLEAKPDAAPQQGLPQLAFNKAAPEKELTPKTDQASEPQAGALLKAFAKDTGPAAEAVKRLLENPTPETCSKLLDDLPALLPDDPELATVIAEAMAAEFADVIKNKTDAQGNEHAEDNGQFTEKGSGGSTDADDLDDEVANVSSSRISEIVSGKSKDPVSVAEGLAVVLSNPTFRDRFGREMRFDSSFANKYRRGIGRSMNKSDVERFKLVQPAIYAVTHDEHPVITFRGKKIVETTDLPYGSQRCYRTPSTNGEIWAISWADKVYIRSIQERAKNNPPYK